MNTDWKKISCWQKNWGLTGGFAVKRLVWQGEAPKSEPAAPETKEKDKEAEAKAPEITDKTDFLEKLNLNETDIKYPPNFLRFQDAVKKALTGLPEEQEKLATKFKVTEKTLIEGLAQNLGLGTAVNDYAKLGKWLKEKDVKSFEIKDGFWEFKNTQNKNVTEDFKLDDTANPKSEKADVTKEVFERREDEKQKAEDEKKRAEEVDKIDWHEVNSNNEFISLEEDLDKMASSLQEKVFGKVGDLNTTLLKDSEVRTALVDMTKDMPGGSEQEKYANFAKAVKEKGFTQIGVEEGKVVFMSLDGQGKTENPLGFVDTKYFIHEKAKGKFEEKRTQEKTEQAEKDKQAQELKTDKESPYQNTIDWVKEQTGQEANPLYLEAFKALQEFTPPKQSDFKIQFNGLSHDCYISKDPDGRIRWQFKEDKNAFIIFRDMKAALTEFNSGHALQMLQVNNLRTKERFTEQGLKVDEGPDQISKNTFTMELDWPNYVFRKDPVFTMTALPHGEIGVKVDLAFVGTDPEHATGEYKFQATDFNDMLRKMERMRQYYTEKQNSDTFGGALEQENKDRWWDKGQENLQKVAETAGLDIGKIMSFRTARGGGFEMATDWMLKQDPNERIKLKESNGQFELSLKSKPEMVLGSVDSVVKVMDIIAKQKQYLGSQGGEQLMENDAREEMRKRGVELYDDIKVVALADLRLGGNIVGLSRGGSEVKYVDLGNVAGMIAGRFGKEVEVPTGAGEAAPKEGVAVAPAETAAEDAAKALDQKVLATDFGLWIEPAPERPENKDAQEAIKRIEDKITDPVKKQLVRDMLEAALVGTPAEKINEHIIFHLQYLLNIDGQTIEDTESSEEAVKLLTEKINSNFDLGKLSDRQFVSENLDQAVIDKLQSKPRSLIYLADLIFLARATSGDGRFMEEKGFSPEARNKYLEDYKKLLSDKVNGIANEMADQSVVAELKKLKTPLEFRDEWTKKYAEEKAKVEKSQQDEAKKEKIATNMDLGTAEGLAAQFVEKPGAKPLVVAEWERMKANIPELREAKVSAVSENSWVLDEVKAGDSLHLNVKIDGKDYTVGISRTASGAFNYTKSIGWNNVSWSHKHQGPVGEKPEDVWKFLS